jgi:hypothetical protein
VRGDSQEDDDVMSLIRAIVELAESQGRVKQLLQELGQEWESIDHEMLTMWGSSKGPPKPLR